MTTTADASKAGAPANSNPPEGGDAIVKPAGRGLKHYLSFRNIGAVYVWAVIIVVKKLEPQYRIFALVNGILWGAVAIVGWTLPDFHGLDAFNRLDTFLHTIVSVTGLLSAALTPRWRPA